MLARHSLEEGVHINEPIACLCLSVHSFEAYSDRLISATERRASVLVGVLPFLAETPLAPGLGKSHDEFAYYEAAFNDLRCASASVSCCVFYVG